MTRNLAKLIFCGVCIAENVSFSMRRSIIISKSSLKFYNNVCYEISFFLSRVKTVLKINSGNRSMKRVYYRVKMCHFVSFLYQLEYFWARKPGEFLKGLNERKWVVIACLRVGWIICLTVNIFKKDHSRQEQKFSKFLKRLKIRSIF